MQKYILVDWPEIQDFMDDPNYLQEVYFAVDKESSIYFVPEDMYYDKMGKCESQC